MSGVRHPGPDEVERHNPHPLNYHAVVNPALATKKEALIALCRKYRVSRLDAFGSAAGRDFRPGSSDVDLLVEFEEMSFSERADAYLGFLTEVEALPAHHVDLVELRRPNPIWAEA